MEWFISTVANLVARSSVRSFENAYFRTLIMQGNISSLSESFEACFSSNILPFSAQVADKTALHLGEMYDQKMSEALQPVLGQMIYAASRRGDLSHVFQCIEMGIDYANNSRMLSSSVMMANVYSASLPLVLHEEIRAKNPAIDYHYLRGLSGIFNKDSYPKSLRCSAQNQLRSGIEECDVYGLWPNPYVKPHVMMIAQMSSHKEPSI